MLNVACLRERSACFFEGKEQDLVKLEVLIENPS